MLTLELRGKAGHNVWLASFLAMTHAKLDQPDEARKPPGKKPRCTTCCGPKWTKLYGKSDPAIREDNHENTKA